MVFDFSVGCQQRELTLLTGLRLRFVRVQHAVIVQIKECGRIFQVSVDRNARERGLGNRRVAATTTAATRAQEQGQSNAGCGKSDGDHVEFLRSTNVKIDITSIVMFILI